MNQAVVNCCKRNTLLITAMGFAISLAFLFFCSAVFLKLLFGLNE